MSLQLRTLFSQSNTGFQTMQYIGNLIFLMRLMEQEMFSFYHIIDIWDEMPAHPGLEKKKNISEITGQRASWPGRTVVHSGKCYS